MIDAALLNDPMFQHGILVPVCMLVMVSISVADHFENNYDAESMCPGYWAFRWVTGSFLTYFLFIA